MTNYWPILNYLSSQYYYVFNVPTGKSPDLIYKSVLKKKRYLCNYFNKKHVLFIYFI